MGTFSMRCCWGKFDFVIWGFLIGGPPAHPKSDMIAKNKMIFFISLFPIISNKFGSALHYFLYYSDFSPKNRTFQPLRKTFGVLNGPVMVFFAGSYSFKQYNTAAI
jgi:hypothetical protein